MFLSEVWVAMLFGVERLALRVGAGSGRAVSIVSSFGGEELAR